MCNDVFLTFSYRTLFIRNARMRDYFKDIGVMVFAVKTFFHGWKI